MKTRAILLWAVIVTSPFAFVAACNSDDSQTKDSGPQNGQDTGTGTDTSTGTDTGTGNDSGTQPDAPNACSTGVAFDNSLVPGYPSAIPQP